MSENEKILCSDSSCRFNVGGGYYGVCHHPAQLAPHYTGGIDRLYRSSCKAREPRSSKVVVMGGMRGGGKTAMVEAIEKAFKEAEYDRTKTD